MAFSKEVGKSLWVWDNTQFLSRWKNSVKTPPGAVLRTLAFLPFVSGRTLFSRYLNGQNKTFFSAIFRWLDFFDSTNFWGRAEIFLVLLTSLAWQTWYTIFPSCLGHWFDLRRLEDEKFAKNEDTSSDRYWSCKKKTFLDRLKETFLASKKRIHFYCYFYSSFHPDIELLHQNVDKSNREKIGTK